MTPISMGIQSPLVISCPCIALPRGTVVVLREDLEWALDLIKVRTTDAKFSPKYLRLRAALEKKP